jgi:cytochrome c oxidase subunit 3
MTGLTFNAMRDTPFSDQHSRFLAGVFGVRLFIVSLSMLFGASLLAFVIIRVQLEQKHLWPENLPDLPPLLWLSTGVLLVSSVTMQWALAGVRAGQSDSLRIGMALTMVLGAAFLMIQARCWLIWTEPISQRWMESDEYRFALTSFYILTGLHALHVIGGLVPMAIVTRNAFVGMYSAEHYAGVRYTAMYWHFLGAVWIVLYAAILLGL